MLFLARLRSMLLGMVLTLACIAAMGTAFVQHPFSLLNGCARRSRTSSTAPSFSFSADEEQKAKAEEGLTQLRAVARRWLAPEEYVYGRNAPRPLQASDVAISPVTAGDLVEIFHLCLRRSLPSPPSPFGGPLAVGGGEGMGLGVSPWDRSAKAGAFVRDRAAAPNYFSQLLQCWFHKSTSEETGGGTGKPLAKLIQKFHPELFHACRTRMLKASNKHTGDLFGFLILAELPYASSAVSEPGWLSEGQELSSPSAASAERRKSKKRQSSSESLCATAETKSAWVDALVVEGKPRAAMRVVMPLLLKTAEDLAFEWGHEALNVQVTTLSLSPSFAPSLQVLLSEGWKEIRSGFRLFDLTKEDPQDEEEEEEEEGSVEGEEEGREGGRFSSFKLPSVPRSLPLPSMPSLNFQMPFGDEGMLSGRDRNRVVASFAVFRKDLTRVGSRHGVRQSQRRPEGAPGVGGQAFDSVSSPSERRNPFAFSPQLRRERERGRGRLEKRVGWRRRVFTFLRNHFSV